MLEMASLVFSDGSGRQVVYPLDKEKVTIGRSTDSDIVSLDLRVSRHHASIGRSTSGGWTVKDEGSSLGVYVNQRRVSEAALCDGDVIRIGDSVYSFLEMPSRPLERLSEFTGQIPSSAGIRGDALVAELQDGIASLRTTVSSLDSDPRILGQCFDLVHSRLDTLRSHLVLIERARLMMQTLFEVGKTINSSYDRDNLLEIILQQAVDVVRAERGFLTLYDGLTGQFERRAAIHMGEGTDKDFSTGIALSVAESGKPVLTTDAMSDERFRERQSVVDLNIRSSLCVPLVDRSQATMGVIYVDTRASVGTFALEDQDFLMAFANYASIAIENAALFKEAAAKARMEEELRQARKLDAVKSDLISIVSHDVRTPLTSIKSYAEILYDDIDQLETQQQRQYLEIINREADRLSRLVTNYLDLQKIEAGKMHLTLEDLDVADLVEESLEAFRGAALSRKISLEGSIEATRSMLRGDRDRLLQVLANLLSNALKFTAEGGRVELRASDAALPDGAPAVELVVTDTGVGIAPDKLEALFRRFSQLGEPGSGQTQGTGLGLVFSREIVELHGGCIGVTSEPGRGSSFRVVLPAGE